MRRGLLDDLCWKAYVWDLADNFHAKSIQRIMAATGVSLAPYPKRDSLSFQVIPISIDDFFPEHVA